MKVKFNYKEGFVSYPEAKGDDPAAKAPYRDHGTGMPDKTRYFSKEEAGLEWEKLWMKSWAIAGIAQDVPEIGDYFRYDLGRESFIVVRTGDGNSDIKAFYNVCPHRGNRVVHNEFGHLAEQCFTCDFHGWQYNLDGTNKLIRDEILFREEVICDRPGLTEVSCDVWQSLVFVNPDPNAGPLLDHLGVMPEHLKDYEFDKLRVLRDVFVKWDANWKTAQDAFVEFYHADDVHPEAIPLSETFENQYDLYDKGISRMVIRNGYVSNRFDDRDTVNEGLEMFVTVYGGNVEDYKHLKGFEYNKALADTKRKWGKKHGYDFFDKLTDDQVTDDWNYHVFPNATINVFADTVLLQIFRPHPTNPSKSIYNVITLCLPVSDDVSVVLDTNQFGPSSMSPPGWKGEERPARVHAKTLEDLGYLLAQDARRVPEVQRGIESRSFKGARLSESEIRIRHYLAEIDKYIGR